MGAGCPKRGGAASARRGTGPALRNIETRVVPVDLSAVDGPMRLHRRSGRPTRRVGCPGSRLRRRAVICRPRLPLEAEMIGWSTECVSRSWPSTSPTGWPGRARGIGPVRGSLLGWQVSPAGHYAALKGWLQAFGRGPARRTCRMSRCVLRRAGAGAFRLRQSRRYDDAVCHHTRCGGFQRLGPHWADGPPSCPARRVNCSRRLKTLPRLWCAARFFARHGIHAERR